MLVNGGGQQDGEEHGITRASYNGGYPGDAVLQLQCGVVQQLLHLLHCGVQLMQ